MIKNFISEEILHNNKLKLICENDTLTLKLINN